MHATRTDVFELQLAAGATRRAGLALAAALREALAERLGADTREIGVAIGRSTGPADEGRVSVFLHDRASGGAGLVSRLAESDWFDACTELAARRLDCHEGCDHGCPACVLRPDLNFFEEPLDRPGGLALVETLRDRLNLPADLQVFGPKTLVLGSSLADWLDRQRRAGSLSGVTLFLHGRPETWEIAAWPFAALLARLKESGVTTRLVIESGVLMDSGLEVSQKLDLHRLSAHAVLARLEGMPMAGDAPVLAIVEQGGRTIAIAASDKAESIPGPAWGLGASMVLLQGPAPVMSPTSDFDSERLVMLSAGNARLIRLTDKLDGPVGGFGRAFWTVIARESLLTIAAMKTQGVRSVEYIDRYFLTPLNLRLLREVLATMPGAKDIEEMKVLTARHDRYEGSGWAVFHSFTDDGQRKKVIQALLPKISVDIRAKADLPHARSLNLTLSDGRRVVLLLDQGFGAWRAEGEMRHDFKNDPPAQARALRAASFRVVVEAKSEVPIILEDGAG